MTKEANDLQERVKNLEAAIEQLRTVVRPVSPRVASEEHYAEVVRLRRELHAQATRHLAEKSELQAEVRRLNEELQAAVATTAAVDRRPSGCMHSMQDHYIMPKSLHCSECDEVEQQEHFGGNADQALRDLRSYVNYERAEFGSPCDWQARTDAPLPTNEREVTEFIRRRTALYRNTWLNPVITRLSDILRALHTRLKNQAAATSLLGGNLPRPNTAMYWVEDAGQKEPE